MYLRYSYFDFNRFVISFLNQLAVLARPLADCLRRVAALLVFSYLHINILACTSCRPCPISHLLTTVVIITSTTVPPIHHLPLSW